MSLTKVIGYVSGVTTIFSGSLLDPWCPRGTQGSPQESNCNFSKSKCFANKSCQVCFRDDKNAFGVIPDPLGSRGHLGFAPGVQTETATNQKILLTKVVRYASGMKKWHLESPLTHWGPRGTKGGLRGSNWNLIKSKYFAKKSCQVCFSGDKNAFRVTPDPRGSRGHLGFAPGGQTETATNQKISLTKVVRYASGVTKWSVRLSVCPKTSSKSCRRITRCP